MNIRKLFYSIFMICFVLCSIFFLQAHDLYASVTEGKAGEVMDGSYAVIINTNLTKSRNTGTLIFDNDTSADSKITSRNAADPMILESINSTNQDSKKISLNSTKESTISYQIGEEKYIHRSNGVGKTYVCIGIGEHCYIWMEKDMKVSYDALSKTSLIASDMASVYDGMPYQILNKLSGNDFPYEDGSGKLSILLESLSSASGMYMYDEGITAIHINTPAASSYNSGEMSKRNGLLVHEGQHALLWLTNHFPSNETYMWLNEGLSVAAMDYLWGGIDSSGWLNGIASDAGIRNGCSLLYNTYRNNTAQDYSMPYLFVRYVIDRMAGGYDPMKVLPDFYHVDASSLSCDKYLEKVTGISMKELLADFYTAIASGETSGNYSFLNDRIASLKANEFPLFAGESEKSHTLPPASAIIIKLKDSKFNVPTDGDSDIIYRVIDQKNDFTSPEKGTGTSSDPYQIKTINDLNLILDHPGASYRLMNDIVVNDQINFTISYFSGTLDGNGYEIKGLKHPLVSQNHGTIKNLKILADFEQDCQNTQGVFAQNNSGKIIHCSVSGIVNGYMGGDGAYNLPSFGAIVGQNEIAGTISSCTSTLDVNLCIAPMKSYIGGICAINYGTIGKCISNGTIKIIQKHSDTPVYLGGITGITDMYGSMGSVIKQCLHVGTLSVSDQNGIIGQLCGIVSNNITNVGIDTHLSCSYAKKTEIPLIGSTLSMPSSCELLSNEAMKESDSYKGWDFDVDFKMSENGFPVLRDDSDIISISTSDTPTSCYVGEIPTSFGSLIINQKTLIPITEDMIKDFDNTSVGEKQILVNYRGKQTTFSMNVIEPETSQIQSLVISKRPKTSYNEGDLFDSSGLSLFGTINGQYVYIYGGYTYPKTPLKAGDTTVSIDYFGKQVPVNVQVAAKKATSITILAQPEKTSYTSGENLDLSGLRMQITYNTGAKSAIFTSKDFDTYHVGIALGKDKTVKSIQKDYKLQSADNESSLLFYLDNILPGQYGSISTTSKNIRVLAPLEISDTTMHLSENNTNTQYISTSSVTGGCGKYTTKVITENLPEGLKRYDMPGDFVHYFSYSGTITAKTGKYISKYEVSDQQTGEILPVTITIYVHPSNEARFYKFDLRKIQNPTLKEDVVGKILEDTIILRILKGTDVTSLKPEIDYASSAGTTLNDAYWNGTVHDFTTPVKYVLTAPDGKTEKTYTVKVEFYDPDSDLDKDDPIKDDSGKDEEKKDDPIEDNSKKDPIQEPTNSSPSNKEDSVTDNEKNHTPTTSVDHKEKKLPLPSVGSKITYKKGIYQILSVKGNNKTVKFIKPTKKSIKTYKIPSTIKYQSNTYKVTQIAPKAFYKCKKLKRLTLPSTITKIGKKAFYKCNKKIKIYVPHKQYKKYKKIFKKARISMKFVGA